MPETLLTAKEVGDRLKISRTTIYRLVRRGKLAPVKIEKSLRFKESDIIHLIDVSS